MTEQKSEILAQESHALVQYEELAKEYEAGLVKMVASGYEEFGLDVQRRHQMVITALRAYSRSPAGNDDLRIPSPTVAGAGELVFRRPSDEAASPAGNESDEIRQLRIDNARLRDEKFFLDRQVEQLTKIKDAAVVLVDEIAKSGTHMRWKRLSDAISSTMRAETASCTCHFIGGTCPVCSVSSTDGQK